MRHRHPILQMPWAWIRIIGSGQAGQKLHQVDAASKSMTSCIHALVAPDLQYMELAVELVLPAASKQRRLSALTQCSPLSPMVRNSAKDRVQYASGSISVVL
jgi:hypothetical protein